MTRTFSYARVSTRDQADTGFSLAAQRERLAAYARFNNLPEPTHYEDPAVSGRKDVRPAFTAMMAGLESGDTVLAKDLSRIGRGGIVQTLTIIRDIEARGARLVLIDQSLDTSTPFGRAMLSILATFAEFELEQTKERSMIGRAQAARSGYWPQGSVPYGYQRSGQKLELNPDTQEQARTALLAMIGKSYDQAIQYLESIGLPSPMGAQRWSSSTLVGMLRQTAYIGQAVFTTDGEKITIPCPALLTQDEWQAIHHGRRPSKGGTKRPDLFPLVSHVRCPHGAPFIGSILKPAGKQYFYYYVSPRAQEIHGCDCKRVHREVVEQAARQILAGALRDPSDPLAIRALSSVTDPQTKDLQRQQKEVQEALSKLTRLRVLGEIEESDYLQLRGELKAKERALGPKRPKVVVPPAMLELADDVEACSNEHLAELLDLLEVRFVLHPESQLELTHYKPFDQNN